MLQMKRSMTQNQVVTKHQLENLDITRCICSHIEYGHYSIRIPILSGLVKLFQRDYNTFFQKLDFSYLKAKPEINPLITPATRSFPYRIFPITGSLFFFPVTTLIIPITVSTGNR